MSVSNLKRIAQFVQKLLRGPKIRSRDPSLAHLGVVLWSLRREAPSSMSVPNLKRIVLLVQKLLRGSQILPRHRPLLGGVGRPKFNQLEMVTTFSYKPSLVRIDVRNFVLSW